MISRVPLTYSELLQSRAAKAILPMTLMGDELQAIRPSIRENATFSAQTDNARHVEEIRNIINKSVKGQDFATSMQELRDSVKKLGFDPQTGTREITNLASDARVRLVVEFNTTRMRAAAQHAQAQQSLDLFPAMEFLRVEDRIEKRNWPERWQAAGGEFFPGNSDYPEGRMVALINDPIWSAINAFGVDYAPFDWGSGMGTELVGRLEAEEMGLIQENEQVMPEPTDLPDPESDMGEISEDLRQQILDDLGPGYHFNYEGILTRD